MFLRLSSIFACVWFVLFVGSCNPTLQKNKKVLFTTPEGYAQRLQDALDEVGVTPVSLPLIETIIQENNPGLEAFITNPKDIDWIAFSSRKAIEAFAQHKERLKVPNEVFKNIKFCAIGKDAEYMRSLLGIRPNIIPKEPSPAGIVEALKSLPDISGKRIIVLAPEVEGIKEPNVVPDFIDQLSNLGMEVQGIHVYTTRPTVISKKKEWLDAILNGEYDVIAFTSTAEVEAFLLLTAGHQIPLSQTFACFGPYTASNARNMGLKIEIIASDFSSFKGFAKEIVETIHTGEKQRKLEMKD